MTQEPWFDANRPELIVPTTVDTHSNTSLDSKGFPPRGGHFFRYTILPLVRS